MRDRQQPDWPNFTWPATRLAAAEEQFLLRGGSFEHLSAASRQQITVESLCAEAMTTSEIEGEIISRESVQSSIRRQLGLGHDGRRARAAEFGIAEMMINLHRNSQSALDESTLFNWHSMLCNGRRDLHDVGRFRRHEEPMQVVSGRLDAPRVYFSAPPSSQVGGEMALAQSLGGPSLIALATTTLTRRRSYYDALEAANKANEISDWLAWSAGITLEAQQRSQSQVTFSVEKARFFERFGALMNKRRWR